jgi:hypothetical protein
LVQVSSHERGLAYSLGIAKRINDSSGVLTWNPELLEEDLAMAQDGAFPLIEAAPRLFLSYRWSYAIDELGLIDFLAGTLFARGYDIVFDRDPRWQHETLSAGDVLLLMFGCTHFVPVSTRELVSLFHSPGPATSALYAEWALAHYLSEGPRSLAWKGLWLSGDALIAPLQEASVADVRAAGYDALDRHFPERSFTVTLTTVSGDQKSLGPFPRWHLREAVATARATPGCREVTIRDTTA